MSEDIPIQGLQKTIEQTYILQGGISTQSGTSTQNAGVSLVFPKVPLSVFGVSNSLKPVLMCGLKYTSQYDSNILACSVVQDASGNIRLAVNTRSEDAVSPAAPTAVSVGVASGVLVAASTTRRHLVLVNTSAAARISLGFGNAAVLDSGITLYPNGGSYEMSEAEGNLYRGAINAIASVAATNCAVQQDA